MYVLYSVLYAEHRMFIYEEQKKSINKYTNETME